jgi:hypothetical protein
MCRAANLPPPDGEETEEQFDLIGVKLHKPSVDRGVNSPTPQLNLEIK